MFQNISIYEQLTALPYLPAYKRLIEGAIELDVFSQLEEPVTAADLAQRMGWHEANTLYLLQGLNSIDYVKKRATPFKTRRIRQNTWSRASRSIREASCFSLVPIRAWHWRVLLIR